MSDRLCISVGMSDTQVKKDSSSALAAKDDTWWAALWWRIAQIITIHMLELRPGGVELFNNTQLRFTTGLFGSAWSHIEHAAAFKFLL